MFGETETEPGGFSQRLGSDHGFSGFNETRNVTACVCWDSHDRGRVHGETGGGLVRHRLGGQEEYDSNAAAMGIQKYVFYSIDKCEKYRDVPLMNMKYAVEEYFKSEWDELCRVETVRVYAAVDCGYAVPVLEEQSLWGTDDDTKTAYLDTQDVAQEMTMAAVRREEANGKVLTLAGPKAYTVNQVIQLCEKLGGNEAR